MRIRSLLNCLCAVAGSVASPFLKQTDNSTWVFGNDLFNVTQGPVYATKVYYRGHELVGPAVGHYMGYGRSSPAHFAPF